MSYQGVCAIAAAPEGAQLAATAETKVFVWVSYLICYRRERHFNLCRCVDRGCGERHSALQP